VHQTSGDQTQEKELGLFRESREKGVEAQKAGDGDHSLEDFAVSGLFLVNAGDVGLQMVNFELKLGFN
jgi:hypothetical protein